MTISDYIIYQSYIKNIPMEKRANIGYATWRALTAIPRIFPWLWNSVKGTVTGGKKLLLNIRNPLATWNKSKELVPMINTTNKAGKTISVRAIMPESGNFSNVQTIRNRQIASPSEIREALLSKKPTVEGKIIPHEYKQIEAWEKSQTDPNYFKKALTNEERRAIKVMANIGLISGGLLHGEPTFNQYKGENFNINNIISNIGLPEEKAPFE